MVTPEPGFYSGYIDAASAPGVDGMLNCLNISLLVVVIGCGGIFRNDLLNGHQSPLGHIEIADQLVPLEEAIFPAVHNGEAMPVGTGTGASGNAANVAERLRFTRYS